MLIGSVYKNYGRPAGITRIENVQVNRFMSRLL